MDHLQWFMHLAIVSHSNTLLLLCHGNGSDCGGDGGGNDSGGGSGNDSGGDGGNNCDTDLFIKKGGRNHAADPSFTKSLP